MPQITTESRELVHKLKKLQISEDTPARNLRTYATDYQCPRQWRPQGFQTIYTPNTRPCNYRVNFNNPGPFSPPNARTIQRESRNHNPTVFFLFFMRQNFIGLITILCALYVCFISYVIQILIS